jgi:hypothetical protein
VAVAGPVIQATGRSEFEDGSGDFVSGYSYHMSVHTGLPVQLLATGFVSHRETLIQYIALQSATALLSPS